MSSWRCVSSRARGVGAPARARRAHPAVPRPPDGRPAVPRRRTPLALTVPGAVRRRAAANGAGLGGGTSAGGARAGLVDDGSLADQACGRRRVGPGRSRWSSGWTRRFVHRRGQPGRRGPNPAATPRFVREYFGKERTGSRASGMSGGVGACTNRWGASSACGGASNGETVGRRGANRPGRLRRPGRRWKWHCQPGRTRSPAVPPGHSPSPSGPTVAGSSDPTAAAAGSGIVMEPASSSAGPPAAGRGRRGWVGGAGPGAPRVWAEERGLVRWKRERSRRPSPPPPLLLGGRGRRDRQRQGLVVGGRNIGGTGWALRPVQGPVQARVWPARRLLPKARPARPNGRAGRGSAPEPARRRATRRSAATPPMASRAATGSSRRELGPIRGIGESGGSYHFVIVSTREAGSGSAAVAAAVVGARSGPRADRRQLSRPMAVYSLSSDSRWLILAISATKR